MSGTKVLTPTDVREIKRLVADGSLKVGQGNRRKGLMTMTELALRLGVNVTTVSKVAQGKHYKGE